LVIFAKRSIWPADFENAHKHLARAAPVAAPMIGGMITSTILTLIVIPALYAFIQARRLKALNGTET